MKKNEPGLRREIIAALDAAGLSPLHRLGQNFMVDGGALAFICDEAGAAPGMRVVEIGPGTGVLTDRLLDRGATVLAVEIDRGLCALLGERFAGRAVTFVHGDALSGKNRLHPDIEAFAREPWRLCANLPYDIALPVLLNCATLIPPQLQPESAVVTVQYEAAERLCSRPGDDAWGASAAVLQAGGMPEILRKLAPSSFHPQPRVDSAVILWRPQRRVPDGFGRWCRRVFAARRKVLTRALRDTGLEREAAEAACRACRLDATRRLESLSTEELLALYQSLS